MISFETAYSWLNFFTPSHLSLTARQVAQRLQRDLRGFRRARADRDAETLISLGAAGQVAEELAECHVVAAWAAYHFSDLAAARAHLESAAGLYAGFEHHSAVVRWLLGCVLWGLASPDLRAAALGAFQDSIRRFEALEAHFAFSPDPRRHWYRFRVAEMQESIRQRIALSGDPDDSAPTLTVALAEDAAQAWQLEYPQESTAPALAPAEIDVAVRPEASLPPAEEAPIPVTPETALFSILFQAFPVSEVVPAGGFGPTGSDPHPIAHVQLDRLIIDGRLYRIRPLKRNGKIINLSGYLQRGCKLNAVRIHGDSMNKTGIEEGDFVLIVIQEDAEDRDIVVAGIENEDSLATIKRLRKINGQIILWPESTNPVHQPRLIGPDDAFHVVGVALAVLKPVGQS